MVIQTLRQWIRKLILNEKYCVSASLSCNENIADFFKYKKNFFLKRILYKIVAFSRDYNFFTLI